ncbi:zinc ABC transporter substrate-binding protein [Canibacter sp. lx-45]|uniref:metal ABC transporter substrate-binding protein n=1 Tax=Canibacter zhuwentaonis TaxID=2837491 RepID=UPI001BDC982B|nr:metal ABC transporter substrate-binding protein [Canibacter zhuwentaonis]MBT1035775.1 zinc ABC transporter substrate-binding protein [Canibacter zhuwentaonis]
MKKIITMVAGAALLFGMTGCTNTENAATNKLEVTVSTTQINDFVSQIAGDKVNLHRLLKPGASAHGFDPSPAELAALKKSDLLVLNGAGLDSFMDPVITSSGFKGKKISAVDGIDKKRAEAETTAAKEALEAIGESADEHSDEHSDEQGNEQANENGDEHDEDRYGAINPHIWTSPEFVRQIVNYIAKELAELDPANATTYTQNATAYGAKLDELNRWIKSEYAKVDPAKKKFVSSHNALVYYLSENNIEYVGGVIPSFEDNAEPSAAEINTLVQNIKTKNVPAVFVESSVSSRLGETVAREAGVPIVQDPIYADSLAASGEAASYIGSIISNTRTILKAWGYPDVSVPSSLK